MVTRDVLRENGQTLREKLFGAAGDGAPAAMRTVTDEAVFGAIWNRPGLAIEDRMLCALSALAAVQRLRKLERYTGAALDMELSPRSIVEVCIQVGIYAGFAASEEAVEAVNAVLAARGLEPVEDAERADDLELLSERGAGLMRQLHGERATQGYAAPGNAITGALYPLAIQYGYGEIWFREGLDIRHRALVAVAAFTALKMDVQVAKFARSALNVGLSQTEVVEAIIQTAPLTGFAPALNALALLSAALEE